MIFFTKALIIYAISEKIDYENTRLTSLSIWLCGFSSHMVCAYVAYELIKATCLVIKQMIDCSFKCVVVAFLILSYISPNIQVLLGVYYLLSNWNDIKSDLVNLAIIQLADKEWRKNSLLGIFDCLQQPN